jgi:Flp pilus assembly protein TadB
MPNDAGLSVTLIVFLSLLVTLPFLVLALVFVGRLVRNSARNRALLANGEPAPACILSASDTGVTVNDSPQVRLRLEVRPEGRPPYEAETTLLVGRLQVGMLAPRMPVRVKFDPADPSRVAVESLGAY